jgi:HEAT repeat protein
MANPHEIGRPAGYHTKEFLSSNPPLAPVPGGSVGRARGVKRRLEMILRGTTRRRASCAAWFCVLGLGTGAFLPGLAAGEDPSAAKEKRPGAITVEESAPARGAEEKAARAADEERRLSERIANVERKLQQMMEALERLEKKLSDQGAAPPRSPEASPRYKGKALEEWLRDLVDRDRETAVRATQAVAAMGKDALPALRESLKSPDALVRENAVGAVAMMGSGAGAQGIEALVERLEDEDLTVRRRAASSLGSRAWDLFTEKDGVLVSRDPPSADAIRRAVPILIKALGEGSEMQETAARALGLFRSEAREAVPALEPLLAAPDEKLQNEAAVALGTIAREKTPAAVVPILCRALERYENRLDGRGKVRGGQSRAAGMLEIFEVLQGMGPAARAAIPTLRKQLYSADGDTGFQSAIALARMDPKNESGAIPEVVTELMDRVESGSWRMQAIQALGEMGPLAKEAIPALEKVAQEGLPGSARPLLPEKGAGAVRRPVARRAAGPLPEEDYREAAAEALWKIRGK